MEAVTRNPMIKDMEVAVMEVVIKEETTMKVMEAENINQIMMTIEEIEIISQVVDTKSQQASHQHKLQANWR